MQQRLRRIDKDGAAQREQVQESLVEPAERALLVAQEEMVQARKVPPRSRPAPSLLSASSPLCHFAHNETKYFHGSTRAHRILLCMFS